ncbi:gag/pol protein [Cucumis melo var. makuwa]|nr:gag/pol protein [Cucumis melo var. makuwa]
MNDVDKDQWVKAIGLENGFTYFNSVWKLVDLPEGLEGFITQGQEQNICKLNRSIYGLKQASISWNIRFDTSIKSYGFNQNVDEPCLYKKINKGYTDSDFQIDMDSRKNPRQDQCTLNRGAAIWYKIKQGCIVDSTIEAKYIVACEAAKEVVWLKKFLHDLEIVLNMNLLITLYCDNSGAIANFTEASSHR